jgi:hypothetical protein
MNLFSNVCDRCGKLPIVFECGNDDFSKGELAYYHVIPRQCEDPMTLMSNGDLVFKLCISKEHPIFDNDAHICSDCFIEMFGDHVEYSDENPDIGE